MRSRPAWRRAHLHFYIPGVTRYWTVDEARAFLPRLRELVDTVSGAVATAAASKSNGHGTATPAPLTVTEALNELEANDIVLRDTDRGLIDFHARGEDGVVYFLCWLREEDDLEWWHLPEEGFAGRKRLPREPKR